MTSLALLLSFGLASGSPADEALEPAPAEEVWLFVDRPHDGWVELGVSPLLVVSGRAGHMGEGFLDLVLLVDGSRSTADGSGVDVNRDGHAGGIGFAHRRDVASYLSHPATSSDPADSIWRASLEAVKRLVARTDLAHTRIGLVTFRERANVRSSIGNTREELERNVRAVAEEDPYGRTDLGEAITVALRAFPGLGARAAAARPGAERVIVLLSDGRPTVPDPPSAAERRALDAAHEARHRNVRIYSIGLGVPDDEARVLRELAEVSRGAYVPLDRPGDILEVLPETEFRGAADVSIRNLTTREDARAVRVWGDGLYDGYVRLAEGKNQLEVTARARGRELRERRFVYYRHFEPRSERDRDEELRRLLELRDLLKSRGLRVEVEQEVDAARRSRQRAIGLLEIHAEPD